jgi:hypothetical protein
MSAWGEPLCSPMSIIGQTPILIACLLFCIIAMDMPPIESVNNQELIQKDNGGKRPRGVNHLHKGE